MDRNPSIRALSAGERSGLEAWLSSLDRGLIYPAPVFAEFVEQVTGAEIVHLVAERDGRTAGVLPFAVSASVDGACAVNSLPWYGSHGGCWLDDPQDGATRDALLEAYAGELADRAPAFTVTVLSPWEQPFLEAYRSALGHEALDSRIGQVSDLPAGAADPEAELAARLKQKTRNLVRKSCRQGFVEVVGDRDDSWAYLCETHEENMRAVGGAPKPRSHFEALRARFAGRHSRLSIAHLEGRPVAGLLLLKFARTIEYLVPVISKDARPRQPLSFLIWRGMLDSIREGFRFWNWGGTWPTQDSLRHFKAGWGSDEHPYSYLVDATERGLAELRKDAPGTMAKFPYFYLYPLSRLHAADTA